MQDVSQLLEAAAQAPSAGERRDALLVLSDRLRELGEEDDADCVRWMALTGRWPDGGVWHRWFAERGDSRNCAPFWRALPSQVWGYLFENMAFYATRFGEPNADEKCYPTAADAAWALCGAWGALEPSYRRQLLRRAAAGR